MYFTARQKQGGIVCLFAFLSLVCFINAGPSTPTDPSLGDVASLFFLMFAIIATMIIVMASSAYLKERIWLAKKARAFFNWFAVNDTKPQA